MGAATDNGDYQPIRFPNVDPITAKYPELTPYQFASNTPIWGSDLDGLELNVETFMFVDTRDGLYIFTVEYIVESNDGFIKQWGQLMQNMHGRKAFKLRIGFK